MRVQDAKIGLVVNIHGFTKAEVEDKLGKLWSEPGFRAALQYHFQINQQGSGPINRFDTIVYRDSYT